MRTRRQDSILRFLYEYGFITNNLLDKIFYKRDESKRVNKKTGVQEEEGRGVGEEIEDGIKEEIKTGSEGIPEGIAIQENEAGKKKKDREYETNRAYKIRDSLKPLIDEKYIAVYRIGDWKEIGVREVYFLTRKGYLETRSQAQTYEHLVVDVWGKAGEPEVITRNLDNETYYRWYPKRDLKEMELKHNEFLIKLKYALSLVHEKRVILPELIWKEDELFTAEKVDILVEMGEGKFVGLEYERSLKSRPKYTGYETMKKFKKITHPGFFRKRQEDGKLIRVGIICETDAIMRTLIRYKMAIEEPDVYGNRRKLDKFFFISKEGFGSVKEMFLNGEWIYHRAAGREHGREDFQRCPFRAILSGAEKGSEAEK